MSFVGDMFSSSKGAGYQASRADIINQGDLVQGSQQAGRQFQNTAQQQQALINALQAQSQGVGPSPAQGMLQQATQQNIAQGAGLVAGTKGINPALAARLAGQQTTMANQEAANQASILRANQQLAAQGQLGGALGQLGGQQLAQQNLYQNAIQAQNAANVGMTGNMNQANAGIAGINAQTQGQFVGGLFSGASTGLMAAAHGGQVPVPHYAGGGAVASSSSGAGSGSRIAAILKGIGTSMGGSQGQYQQPAMFQGGQGLGQLIGSGLKSAFSSQDPNQIQLGSQYQAPAPNLGVVPQGQNASQTFGLSNQFTAPGAQYQLNQGGAVQNLKQGGKVPGEAKVAGDSLKNDTVPAMLSPKEIVLPRSVALHPNAPEEAKKFVAALLAKKHGGRS